MMPRDVEAVRDVTLAEGTAAVRGKKTKKKSSLLFGSSSAYTGAHILDGQHRVGALEIHVRNKGHKSLACVPR